MASMGTIDPHSNPPELYANAQGAGSQAWTSESRSWAPPSGRKAAVSGQVLVVDDEPEMGDLISEALTEAGFSVTAVTRGSEALHRLEQEPFDILITDLNLPEISGLQVCEQALGMHPQLPVFVITAFGSMETAIAALRVGAYDFIQKPIDIRTLTHAVTRAAEHAKLRGEVRRLRDLVAHGEGSSSMVGDSAPVRRLIDLLDRIGDSETTVMVKGESGTGKELVARELHLRSGRPPEKFLAINCAAMPATLLESELFGHVRGAFTDAKTSRDGLFVQASGGTLFLDEIGEMPLEMQPKLLRVLQEGRVRPLGGDKEVAFNTRIIAASNRDLEQEVAAGRFREDLYYRINVLTVEVPPLRDRGRDILLLAQHFLQEAAQRDGKAVSGIASATARKLLDYPWPGNVRELRNCMERAVTLTRHEEILPEDLPDAVRTHESTRLVVGAEEPEELMTLDELEERYIRRVLRAVNGNKTQAAKILGLDRRTLYRRLDRYDAKPNGGEPEARL